MRLPIYSLLIAVLTCSCETNELNQPMENANWNPVGVDTVAPIATPAPSTKEQKKIEKAQKMGFSSIAEYERAKADAYAQAFGNLGDTLQRNGSRSGYSSTAGSPQYLSQNEEPKPPVINASAGDSATVYGNTAYYSGGGSSTRYGDTTYHSNGVSSTQYGNRIYNSNGTSSTKYGNSTYHSNGTSSTTYGNSTYHSNGGVSTTYGNTTYNSGF